MRCRSSFIGAVVVVLALLAPAALASASSHIEVRMLGAGTVRVAQQPAAQPLSAGCPLHAPLANPDDGNPVLACTLDWAPVCTPAGAAAGCKLTARAVAALPAAPDLAASEAGGWAFAGWTAGPCSGAKTLACTFQFGTCAAGGACTYSDVGLGVAFEDTRAPVARIVDRPPALNTTEGGRAAFSFRSNEYAGQEVSTFECRLDEEAWVACPAPPGTYGLRGLRDGVHELRVRATDPSHNLQTAPAAVARWTQRSRPEITFQAAPEAVSGPDAHFDFTAVPADSTFTCRLDDDVDFAPCPGTFDAQGLDDGAHVLTVRATRRDHADLVTEVSRGWTVDSDADDDGSPVGDDCNDADPLINPQAVDAPGDGIDQDCDGVDGVDGADDFSSAPGFDADGDGDAAPPDGGDCDDADPNRSSFGEEIPENGIDEDCDGVDALKPPIGLRFRSVWVVGARSSRLAGLTATRVPAGTVISVSCRGGGCPGRVKNIEVPSRRKTLPLLPYLGRHLRLSAGAVLSLRATKGGRSPEGRRWKVRRDRKPLATAYCVHAGKREPGRC